MSWDDTFKKVYGRQLHQVGLEPADFPTSVGVARPVKSKYVPPLDRSSKAEEEEFQTKLPEHLFYPEHSQSLDLRLPRKSVADGIASFSAAGSELLSFTAPKGSYFRIMAYAVSVEGLVASNLTPSTLEYILRVNNKKALPFHGEPVGDIFRMFPSTEDIKEQDLIKCNFVVDPLDRFSVNVKNTSGSARIFSVRIQGFLEYSDLYINRRFGG